MSIITTLDILDTDGGVDIEIVDYHSSRLLGHINVDLDSKGDLVIKERVLSKVQEGAEEDV